MVRLDGMSSPLFLHRPESPRRSAACHAPSTALGWTLLLLALFVPAPAALSQDASSNRFEAIAKPSRDLELAFTVAGRVAAVRVQPGQTVEAGEVLAQLDDAAVRARLQLLQLRASSDLAVRSAEASLRLAKNDEARIREALSRDAAAPFELERAELQTLQAQLTLELARQRQREAELELVQAQTEARRLTLRAPTAGVVERIDVEPGETVQAHQTVLRLVAIDPLRVEAAIPLQRTLQMQPGDTVWIVWPFEQGTQVVPGAIVQLAAVADAASQTRTVVCHVPNPAKLPAGAEVQLWLVEPPLAQTDASRTRDRPDGSSQAPVRLDGVHGGNTHAHPTP